MGMGKREGGVKLLSELSGLSVAIHKRGSACAPSGSIHSCVRTQGSADSREDGDQRLDDRPPNSLLVAHNPTGLTVRQHPGSRVPAR